jgi:HlyD family secretion protein
MKSVLLAAIVVVGLAGGAAWYWQSKTTPRASFRFGEAKRGRLVATVSSTGTLQPREIVDIGAQVLGRIVFIGKDSNTQSHRFLGIDRRRAGSRQ